MNIEKEPKYFITASELINSYIGNEVNASIKFDHTYIELTGKVEDIIGDKNEATLIIESYIRVIFTNLDQKFQSLVNGDVVILRGILEGNVSLDINSKVILIRDAKVIDKNVPTLFFDLREIDDINLWYMSLTDSDVIEMTGIIGSYSGMYLYLIGLSEDETVIFWVLNDVNLNDFSSGDLVKITSVFNYFDQVTQTLVIKNIQKLEK
jgi:hypothetical protein